MLIFWIFVFIVSLAVLVKGADWLISSSEKIGLAAGLSPFIVGVTIVGIGTSFPELISSLAAVFKGVTEVVAANVIGSNIANILLIIGISAVIGRVLIVKKDMIDLDLSLLAISTVLFLGVVWDKQITLGESLLMIVTYGVYLIYTILDKKAENSDDSKLQQGQIEKIEEPKKEEFIRPKLVAKDFILLVVGLVGLILGAKFLIDALVKISTILDVATGIITITAVAVGTSLPELIVSAKAAFQKKYDLSIGNIVGSNVFNGLMVIGIPGLFKTLAVDAQTFAIGVPALIVATLLFVIAGISRKIHIWEGAFFISVYILFVAKLFNLF